MFVNYTNLEFYFIDKYKLCKVSKLSRVDSGPAEDLSRSCPAHELVMSTETGVPTPGGRQYSFGDWSPYPWRQAVALGTVVPTPGE